MAPESYWVRPVEEPTAPRFRATVASEAPSLKLKVTDDGSGLITEGRPLLSKVMLTVLVAAVPVSSPLPAE